MRIDACEECGEHVNIASDHAGGCSRRQGGGSVVEVQPVLVDAQAAGVAVQYSPATIRSWAARGELERKGRDGKRVLYDLADVYAAAARRAGR